MTWQTIRSGALAAALGLAACGDSFTPTEENVAGTYTAAVFRITTGGITADLLALGATVNLTLSPDGTTSGRLFVPGGDDGADLDEDLAGTWSLTGSTVTFEQAGDTFLPDVEFTAGRNTLAAGGTFGGETGRLELRKTEAS